MEGGEKVVLSSRGRDEAGQGEAPNADDIADSERASDKACVSEEARIAAVRQCADHSPLASPSDSDATFQSAASNRSI